MIELFKQEDKQLHAVWSGVLVVVLSVFLTLVLTPLAAINVASGVTLLIGIAKEVVYDFYMDRGNPNIMDVVANCIGVVGGAILAMVVLL